MLNEQAASIFSRLIDHMDGALLTTFRSRYGPPMRMLDYDFTVTTHKGQGYLYSIAFLHGDHQPFGLSIREQIVFIVVDLRYQSADYQDLIIFPHRYQSFTDNKYEESTSIVNAQVTRQYPDKLEDHILLAQLWLGNIDEQGYIP